MHGRQPAEKASLMVSEARKKALADAIKFTGEHAVSATGLALWLFNRGDRQYDLWLNRDGTVEANRTFRSSFDPYNHRSLGRLLFDSLPPEEVAWVTAHRLLKTSQS